MLNAQRTANIAGEVLAVRSREFRAAELAVAEANQARDREMMRFANTYGRQ